MKQAELAIELLTNNHDKQSFSCGIHSLDNYLKEQATQYMRRSLATTYVLTLANTCTILGYFTLSATSINLQSLPEEISKKLPRHPTVPAILIGRLAASQAYQGKGYGELLLIHALKESLQLSKKIGLYAVVVDAENERVISFYKRYEFIEFPECDHKLFLPMKTISKLLD